MKNRLIIEETQTSKVGNRLAKINTGYGAKDKRIGKSIKERQQIFNVGWLAFLKERPEQIGQTNSNKENSDKIIPFYV